MNPRCTRSSSTLPPRIAHIHWEPEQLPSAGHQRRARPARACAARNSVSPECAGAGRARHLEQAIDDVPFVERTRARRRLPLPGTVAAGTSGDSCRIGVSAPQGHSVPVHLSTALLNRRLLAVAKTRRGKSSLLLRLTQHLMTTGTKGAGSGRGLILVDPHRDLASAVLGLVPRHRQADIVYLDISNRRRPFGINLLDAGLGWIAIKPPPTRYASFAGSSVPVVPDEDGRAGRCRFERRGGDGHTARGSYARGPPSQARRHDTDSRLSSGRGHLGALRESPNNPSLAATVDSLLSVGTDQLLRVRLPAGVVVESPTAGLQPILLLPDVGTRPVASFRTTLRRLDELERRLDVDPPDLTVVLMEAADTEARAAGVESPAPKTRCTWPCTGPLRDGASSRCSRWVHRHGSDKTPQRLGCHPGRHDARFTGAPPLLKSDQLAALLDTTHRRVSALQTGLFRRGFLREVTLDASVLDPTTARRLWLFELTLAGRRQLLRRLGLSSTEPPGTMGISRMARVRSCACCCIWLIRSGLTSFSSTWYSAAGASPERGATTHCSHGAARRRVGVAGAGRKVSAAIDAVTHVSISLEYDRSHRRPREYAAKLDAYYRFETRAGPPVNSRVSRRYWWYPPAAPPKI